MKLIIRSLIVAAFVLIAVAPSYAQKTGYVNSDAIIAAMPESQQAQKTLEDYKKKLDGEIQEKIKVYQTNFQAAQQRVASEMLTPIQKGDCWRREFLSIESPGGLVFRICGTKPRQKPSWLLPEQPSMSNGDTRMES